MSAETTSLDLRRERYEATREEVARLMRGALLWAACTCLDGKHDDGDLDPVHTSWSAECDRVASVAYGNTGAHIIHRVTEHAAWKRTA